MEEEDVVPSEIIWLVDKNGIKTEQESECNPDFSDNDVDDCKDSFSKIEEKLKTGTEKCDRAGVQEYQSVEMKAVHENNNITSVGENKVLADNIADVADHGKEVIGDVHRDSCGMIRTDACESKQRADISFESVWVTENRTKDDADVNQDMSTLHLVPADIVQVEIKSEIEDEENSIREDCSDKSSFGGIGGEPFGTNANPTGAECPQDTPESRKETAIQEKQQFECKRCNMSFNSARYLGIHTRTHGEVKTYICEVCSKNFSFASKLCDHMRTHTGEKSFKCSYCGDCFSRSSNLTSHMRTHTGEKPFKCDLCGKCFTRSDHLASHMLTHTGEKPFKCKVCGKGYSRSFDRVRHMRTHAGEEPFTCEFCGKSFSNSSDHELHVRTHTGEKKFLCEICSKRFTRSTHLSRHLRTHDRKK